MKAAVVEASQLNWWVRWFFFIPGAILLNHFALPGIHVLLSWPRFTRYGYFSCKYGRTQGCNITSSSVTQLSQQSIPKSISAIFTARFLWPLLYVLFYHRIVLVCIFLSCISLFALCFSFRRLSILVCLTVCVAFCVCVFVFPCALSI